MVGLCGVSSGHGRLPGADDGSCFDPFFQPGEFIDGKRSSFALRGAFYRRRPLVGRRVRKGRSCQGRRERLSCRLRFLWRFHRDQARLLLLNSLQVAIGAFAREDRKNIRFELDREDRRNENKGGETKWEGRSHGISTVKE